MNGKSLSLAERLALLGLIKETQGSSSNSPVVADLFNGLWGLVDKTVAGAKVNGSMPSESQNGFKVSESDTLLPSMCHRKDFPRV